MLTKCTECPVGKYGNTTGSQSCKPCQAGTYAHLAGSTVCLTCPIGRAFVAIDTECSVCLGGEFQPWSELKNVECQKCPKGFFNSDKGDTRIDIKHADCEQCSIAEGFVADNTGSMFCDVCPIGKFTTNDLSNPCANCLVGKMGTSVSAISNFRICVQCPLGYSQAVIGLPSCVKCIPGKYQNVRGQADCVECAIGRKFNASIAVGISALNCLACDEGQYQSESGSTFCLPCLTGTFQNEQGGASSKNCPTGWTNGETARSTCVECIAGQFQNQVKSASCQDCTAGLYSKEVGATADTVCKPCTQGTYSSTLGADSSEVCSTCAPGKWSNTLGADSREVCKACAIGMFAAEGASTICIACPLGFTTGELGGKVECSGCDLGMYGSPEILGTCVACPEGQYQNDKGKSVCIDCAVDTYLSDTGKSSPADCTACDAGRTTAGNEGQTIQGSCLCEKGSYNENSTCIDCPDGASCHSKAGLLLSEIATKPGFWRSGPTKVKFWDCDRLALGATDCQGTMMPMNGSNSLVVDSLVVDNLTLSVGLGCKEFHEGVMCGACAKGSARQMDNDNPDAPQQCKECPGGTVADTGPIIGMTLGVLFLFFWVSFMFLLKKEHDSEEEEAEEGEGEEKGTKKEQPIMPENKKDNTSHKNPMVRAAAVKKDTNEEKVAVTVTKASDQNTEQCSITIPDGVHAGNNVHVNVLVPKGIEPGNTKTVNYNVKQAKEDEGEQEDKQEEEEKEEEEETTASKATGMVYAASSPPSPPLVPLPFRRHGLLLWHLPNAEETVEASGDAEDDIEAQDEANAGHAVVVSGDAEDDIEPDIEAQDETNAEMLEGSAGHTPFNLGSNIDPQDCSITSASQVTKVTKVTKAGAAKTRKALGRGKKLIGKLKIITGFVQIFSSLTIVFTVPWPAEFATFLKFPPFKLLDIDMNAIFASFNPCAFKLKFLDSFVLHMLTLPTLILVAACAALLCSVLIKCTSCCCHGKYKVTTIKNRLLKEISFIIFFLYPGMTVKIFRVFKCVELDASGDGTWLYEDLSIRCNLADGSANPEILPYQIFGVVCIGVIVFGIPLATFFLLQSMRHSLYENENTLEKYGSLYEQYEPECYAWEVLVMLKKMALTGGLVLVAPGSAVQILFGALLALFYLLGAVRTAPYEEDSDDVLEIFASLAILLTLLAGFALKTAAVEVSEMTV